MKRFAFVLLVCAASFGSKKGLGQNCSYVLEMYHQLAYPQTATQSAQLSGDLNSVTFNLDFDRIRNWLSMGHDGVLSLLPMDSASFGVDGT